MRITIDTQHDTYEDIHKVLSILTNIIEKKNTSWDGFSNNSGNNNLSGSSNADTTNLMNMFDSGTESKSAADIPPDFSKFLNLVEKKEEVRKEVPRIEFF